MQRNRIPIYKRKFWKDHLVEFPDRRIMMPVENGPEGAVELIREGAEGDIYQQGDPIYADYLNNMELGILNNNLAISTTNEENKKTQLKVMILEAALLGDVKGGLIMENFENVENITLERGIYDEAEKVVFCYDSNGSRIELKGLGAAIA